MLPTMGGQTALNCALDLHEHGVLDKYGVELIGANARGDREGRGPPDVQGRDAEDRAWTRPSRHRALDGGGWAVQKRAESATPEVIRPSFTLGGTGGGIAYNREEFEEICKRGLEPRPTTSC